MKFNDKNILLKIGISFLLVFIFFFYLGSIKQSLQFELKKSDVSTLYKAKKKGEEKTSRPLKFTIDTLENKGADTLETKSSLVKDKLIPGNNNRDTISSEAGIERILLLGDSQLEGLKNPVNAYCMKNNHKLVASVIWYSSTTKNWSETDTLQYYINLYKPTTIIFAIGLNELFVRDLDKRKSYIKNIIRIFEKNKINYSWIGPAAWTKDKGIVSIMEKELGERFFPSHTLTLQRANDGRHPSRNAAKIWFDSVAKNLTSKGIVDFSIAVGTMPKLKHSTTILLKPAL